MLIQNILNESFVLIIVFSLLPLLLCSLISFFIAILQALTQIQEQSISYVIKYSSLLALIWIGGNYFSNFIIVFLQESLKSIALMGQTL